MSRSYRWKFITLEGFLARKRLEEVPQLLILQLANACIPAAGYGVARTLQPLPEIPIDVARSPVAREESEPAR